jgi:hypothetical protein
MAHVVIDTWHHGRASCAECGLPVIFATRSVLEWRDISISVTGRCPTPGHHLNPEAQQILARARRARRNDHEPM